MNKPVIVIHGPQGCGKTRHAQALAKHFGCDRIVDDWEGEDRRAGTLVLTNDVEPASILPGMVVLPFADAMRRAGLQP